jgi:hypothetical protein
LQFILDGTEWPIQRPKDPQRRKDYYSGPKKWHTVKNLVITHKHGCVPNLSGEVR